MATEHVFVTRFNLPTGDSEGLIRAKEGWLTERFSLFCRYTAPSVMAQSSPTRWIVYIDPESPAWLPTCLREMGSAGLMTVVARTRVLKEDLVDDIGRVIDSHTDRVVTTNLDNDDAVARDFCERVLLVASQPGPAAIFIDSGIVLHRTRAYLHVDRANAFRSVVCDTPPSLTCWEDWHTRLHLHMPTRHVVGHPGWLQVIHGRNVSNRVRGRLTSSTDFEDLFPGLLDDVIEPPRWELTVDRVLRRPVRYVRDSGRLMGRRVGVSVVGKERFNRWKGVALRIVSPASWRLPRSR